MTTGDPYIAGEPPARGANQAIDDAWIRLMAESNRPELLLEDVDMNSVSTLADEKNRVIIANKGPNAREGDCFSLTESLKQEHGQPLPMKGVSQ
jgi:hypothetical protein